MIGADHLANRILYAFEVVDRPGTTLHVVVSWNESGTLHAAMIRLVDQRSPQVPKKVWFNAHKMLWEALRQRRTATIFRLMKEGR